MKKLGDLMKELGFNPNAPQGAQEAFLKNLIREAYGVEAPSARAWKTARDENRANASGQLSFDLRDLVATDEIPANTKRAVSRAR